MKEIERRILNFVEKTGDFLQKQKDCIFAKKFGKNDNVIVCKWSDDEKINTCEGKLGGCFVFEYKGVVYATMYFDEFCKKFVCCTINNRAFDSFSLLAKKTLQNRLNAFCEKYAPRVHTDNFCAKVSGGKLFDYGIFEGLFRKISGDVIEMCYTNKKYVAIV